jgi:hypothetical protein
MTRRGGAAHSKGAKSPDIQRSRVDEGMRETVGGEQEALGLEQPRALRLGNEA